LVTNVCHPDYQCHQKDPEGKPSVCPSGPACSIKKVSATVLNTHGIVLTPPDELTCGDDPGTDCLGCPLNEHKASNLCTDPLPWEPGGEFVGKLFQSGCYGNVLRRHYGCLAWWTEINNKDFGKAWKAYATQGDTDAYWWAMGEQKLGQDQYNSEINTYFPSVGYPSDDAWQLQSGDAVDCIRDKSISETDKCAGYPVQSNSSALRSCDKTPTWQLHITLTNIITTADIPNPT